jgi:hypothetical protein
LTLGLQDGRSVWRAGSDLRVTLGDAAFDATYRRGRTLSQRDGIALALAAAEPGPEVASAGPAGPLSIREREIVALLAAGRPTLRSPSGCSFRSTR